MADPPSPTVNPPPVPTGGGLITYSDSYCSTYAQVFEVGATVYFNGQITSQYARTANVLARLYDSSGALITTIINNEAASLPANTVYDLKDDLGAGTAFSIDTTGYSVGIYFLDICISGTNLPTIADLETFKVVAVSPTITSPAIDNASIDQDESATVTCTSETGNIGSVYDGTKKHVMTETSTGEYEVTLYGHNFEPDTYSLKITMENSANSVATDETLTLTVADTNVEAVQHIYNILNDNWNATNVTKPALIIGGGSSRSPDMSDQDVIKLYENPGGNSREYQALSRAYQDSMDSVLLDVHTCDTSTGTRSQMNLIITEAQRVINNIRNSPGGGYRYLTYSPLTIRSEYSDHFRKIIQVDCHKVFKAVST